MDQLSPITNLDPISIKRVYVASVGRVFHTWNNNKSDCPLKGGTSSDWDERGEKMGDFKKQNSTSERETDCGNEGRKGASGMESGSTWRKRRARNTGNNNASADTLRHPKHDRSNLNEEKLRIDGQLTSQHSWVRETILAGSDKHGRISTPIGTFDRVAGDHN